MPRPRFDLFTHLARREAELADLAAATDDPRALLAIARDRAEKAPRRQAHRLDLREAANLAWLAMCSAADVAGAQLGRPAHGGRLARIRTLEAIERGARLHPGSLTRPFDDAHDILHGACFYGDEDRCSRGRVSEEIEDARRFMEDVHAGVERILRRSR